MKLKLKDLKALVRQRVKDKDGVKPLWSDDLLTQVLNQAQWEACRRARLIKDSTTDEVCRIDIDASTAIYEVDKRVIFIRRVKLATRAQPLDLKRVRDMDLEAPGWEAHTGGIVAWIPDYTTGWVRFYRQLAVGSAADYATLTVVRGPLTDMAKPDDEPEINPRFHYKLHHHACALLLSDQDAETYDPKAAQMHADEFTREFGPPSSATEETWIEENVEFASDSGVF